VPERQWSLGAIALAEGRYAEAEAELRAAGAGHECAICVMPDLARLYRATGRPDSALAMDEAYVATPWEWRFETDAFELGRTLGRMGEAYLARGDSARARSTYRRLLTLWRNGDAVLQPELAEARRVVGVAR
jgi:Flp pilus assembly protein TadD